MYKINRNNIFIISLVAVSVFSMQGCDKIDSLTSYFFPGKKTRQAAPAPKVVSIQKQAAAPVQKAAPQPKTSKKNILVKVGTWELTVKEFRERLKALEEVVPKYDANSLEQNKAILEEVINQQLIAQAAQKEGLGEKKEIVLAVEEFRNTLLVREMVAKIVGSIKVTEEEAKDFYEQNSQEFVSQAEWHLREIVVDSEEEAKAISVDLYQGADFVETAKQKSKGKTAATGGDLGKISLKDFTFAKMADVVFTLEKGDVSRPFKGPDGYYIIKVEDKKGGEQQDFESVKEEIMNGLTRIKQQQKIMAKLETIRREINVELNLKLLEE